MWKWVVRLKLGLLATRGGSWEKVDEVWVGMVEVEAGGVVGTEESGVEQR